MTLAVATPGSPTPAGRSLSSSPDRDFVATQLRAATKARITSRPRLVQIDAFDAPSPFFEETSAKPGLLRLSATINVAKETLHSFVRAPSRFGWSAGPSYEGTLPPHFVMMPAVAD